MFHSSSSLYTVHIVLQVMDFGDVTLTQPNSPKVNLPNNNNIMSLNARLMTSPASSMTINCPPPLTPKDPPHSPHPRPTPSSVASQSSSISAITSTTDSSSGTTSISALLTDSPCTAASAATASDTSSAPALTTYKPSTNNNNKGEMTDDGEPLYDSLKQHEMRGEMESGVALDTYLEMKEKLESSEARIQELQNNNAHMRSQLDELCSTVQNLREENKSLRSLYSSGSMGQSSHSTPPLLNYYPHSLYNGDADPQMNVRTRGPVRPISMFEPRQGPPCVTSQCHSLDQSRTSAFAAKLAVCYQ
ncbi:hypothetical protein E2C01_027982 [Portunus trituberculatus]|uniref:Arf GTPase-activating protein GIT1/2 coiled-coil domain-containing protein n=1 Tax=Portunus trituberculatus TaxID=210409 RepID=A0A5B7EMT7_PORTR|nr:hypothetical protein [Portunus trituberculatus]